MPRIPEISSFDLEIKSFKVGIFGKHQKSENIYIYWYDLKDNILTASNTREFNSSVWIGDAVNYDKFAQTYTVISGGWYGEGKGGRWNTIKQTDGEIIFEGIQNFKQSEHSKSLDAMFTINKHRFSNQIGIEINNDTAGHLTFVCKKITFNPTNKIYLHHREENKFINAEAILEPGGLGIVNSRFNIND